MPRLESIADKLQPLKGWAFLTALMIAYISLFRALSYFLGEGTTAALYYACTPLVGGVITAEIIDAPAPRRADDPRAR
jgi:hypothetical protein